MINKNSKIYIAGHTGLVGSAVVRRLKHFGFKNLIVEKRSELDLRDQTKVKNFFYKYKPQGVILCAAKVGGILVNSTKKADFLYDNIMIETNIINSAKENNCKSLVFLGSSCIYPKNFNKAIKEDFLLSSKLEKTNESYAVAKIAGVKLIEAFNFQYSTNFKCLMPCNTYGPNDNYDNNNSHFLPAIIKKIHNAKVNRQNFIKIWGTGIAKRELIYVDDLADACIFFLRKKTKDALINIGSGKDFSIKQYVKIVSKIINHKVKLKYERRHLNGTLRKLLNISLAKRYGWKPKINLNKGIEITYKSYLESL